jgi:NTP pyrophosphatase (non-canonical NTP hydrolase)
MDMTFFRFSHDNRIRCESPDGFNHTLDSWSLSDWMTATVGELGEAANVAKKLNRIRDGIPGNKAGESEPELKAALGNEIADTVIYLDLLAQSVGLDLGTLVRDKWNATSERLGSPFRLE